MEIDFVVVVFFCCCCWKESMRYDWNCPCPGYKEGVVERNLWREVKEVKEREGLKKLKI